MNLELKGKRIRMTETMSNDPQPILKGQEGTIHHTDDLGTIHVNWDNGRRIGVIPNIDKYEIL